MILSASITALDTACDPSDYPDHQGSRRAVQCRRRYVGTPVYS